MSNYTLDYKSDLGLELCARLTTLNYIESDRGVIASVGMDEFFIPPIFLENATDDQGCDFLIGVPRGARIYYQPNAYFFLPCPWPSNDPRFNTFFSQLNTIENTQVFLQGEKINAFFTDRITGG